MSKTMDSPDLIEFGNKMKNRRKKLNISQEELAEKIDISNNTIHRIESAQTTTSIQTLFQIMDTLKTTPEDLLPSRFYKNENHIIPEVDMISTLWKQLNSSNRQVAYPVILSLLNGLIKQQHQ
ncbi:MAG: helix-turn-helix transcriptional regulator [Lachnospiraceae bacterium]|nr:helix-turn-helix transcriptional regulator [Lachnospiraceae bacterium]